MKDLGENPIRTMWGAIFELVTWWLVIFATWDVGLWFGMWIGSGRFPSLWWALYGLWLPLVAWLIYPIIFLGLGTSAAAWYLPMKIDSRRLAIGAVIVNTVVWTAIGAYISWSWPW